MSEQITPFNEIAEKNFSTLDLYTTAITRAHGKNHPEVFEVRELFEAINDKVEKAGTTTPDLEDEFRQLRNITNNYTVPDDACETYEGTYQMLSEADKSYHAS
jgi:regulator of cell morphogenesis and NO signaling